MLIAAGHALWLASVGLLRVPEPNQPLAAGPTDGSSNPP